MRLTRPTVPVANSGGPTTSHAHCTSESGTDDCCGCDCFMCVTAYVCLSVYHVFECLSDVIVSVYFVVHVGLESYRCCVCVTLLLFFSERRVAYRHQGRLKRSSHLN